MKKIIGFTFILSMALFLVSCGNKDEVNKLEQEKKELNSKMDDLQKKVENLKKQNEDKQKQIDKLKEDRSQSQSKENDLDDDRSKERDSDSDDDKSKEKDSDDDKNKNAKISPAEKAKKLRELRSHFRDVRSGEERKALVKEIKRVESLPTK